MKAVALVVSARKHGNCYDFAQFSLYQLAAHKITTELINFYDYQVTPCQRCAYECLNVAQEQIEKSEGKGKRAAHHCLEFRII